MEMGAPPYHPGVVMQSKTERKFIDAHFERIRERLVAEAETARSFHHSLNQGLIREAFIREFLEQSLSPLWHVGTGEILHKDQLAHDQRNQLDVVIHNARFPRISLSKGIDLFFVEAVSSFIEVKTTLKKEHVRRFATVTKHIKSHATIRPNRFNLSGLLEHPRPYSLMFSYGGPNVRTIRKWMKEISEEDEYNLAELQSIDPNKRPFHTHLFIDAIVVLGNGYVYVDSLPFQSPIVVDPEIPKSHIWVVGEGQELLWLWTLISELNQLLFWNDWEVLDYTEGINFTRSISD